MGLLVFYHFEDCFVRFSRIILDHDATVSVRVLPHPAVAPGYSMRWLFTFFLRGDSRIRLWLVFCMDVLHFVCIVYALE